MNIVYFYQNCIHSNWIDMIRSHSHGYRVVGWNRKTFHLQFFIIRFFLFFYFSVNRIPLMFLLIGYIYAVWIEALEIMKKKLTTDFTHFDSTSIDSFLKRKSSCLDFINEHIHIQEIRFNNGKNLLEGRGSSFWKAFSLAFSRKEEKN